MDRNAFVSWLEQPEPWLLEERLLSTVDLPLNLDQNRHNRFHPILTASREQSKLRCGAARGVPSSGGLNHDAEHALGLILRQPERLDGVLDREPVRNQSAGRLRSGSQ